MTLDESLTRLLMVVLTSLTPAERVAFVLHDVFGVPFRGIAEIVGRNPDATRTLARSARAKVHHRREQGDQPGGDRAVVHEFSRACTAGERGRLEPLLDPDITVVVDSGPVPALLSPVCGRRSAAQLLIGLFADETAAVVFEQSVNGGVGLVLRRGDLVVGVVSVNVRNGLIVDAWIVANPDKLRHWNTP